MDNVNNGVKTLNTELGNHTGSVATTAATGHVKVGSFLSVNTAGTLSVSTGTSSSTVSRGDHNHNAIYVNVTGDTMTGNLNMNDSVFLVKSTNGEYSVEIMPGSLYVTNHNNEQTVIQGGSVTAVSFTENGEKLSDKYVTKNELEDNEYAIATSLTELNDRLENIVEQNAYNNSIVRANYIHNSSSNIYLNLKPKSDYSLWDYSNVNGLLTYDINILLGSNGNVGLRYVPNELTDSVEHYITYTSHKERSYWESFYVSNTNNLVVKVKYIYPSANISSFNSGVTAPTVFTSCTKVDTYEYMAKGTPSTGSDSYSRVYFPIILKNPASSSYFGGSLSTIKFMFKFTKGGFDYSSSNITYKSSDLLEIIQIL